MIMPTIYVIFNKPFTAAVMGSVSGHFWGASYGINNVIDHIYSGSFAAGGQYQYSTPAKQEIMARPLTSAMLKLQKGACHFYCTANTTSLPPGAD
jgi:hypothetical protein